MTQKYLWPAALVALTAALSIGVATASAGGGNSANAKNCQKSGWTWSYRSATGTGFNSEEECTGFAAMGGRLSGLQFTPSLNGDHWGSFRAYGLYGSDRTFPTSKVTVTWTFFGNFEYFFTSGTTPLTPTTVLSADSIFPCSVAGGFAYATALTLDGVQLQTPAVAPPCP